MKVKCIKNLPINNGQKFEKGNTYKIREFDDISCVINYEFFMTNHHIYGSHRAYLKNEIDKKFVKEFPFITIFEDHFIDIKQERKEKIQKLQCNHI